MTGIRTIRGLLFLAAASSICSADALKLDPNIFVGTWKEDVANSRRDPGNLLYSFTQESDGSILIVRGSDKGPVMRDRVQFDGKDYPTIGDPRRSVSWTRLNDSTYESTVKREATVLGITRWAISDGGKTLTQAVTPTRVDGQVDVVTTVYERISGTGSSLLGAWKPVSMKTLVPEVLVLKVNGDGELSFYFPKNQSGYSIQIDGKEHGRDVSPPDTTFIAAPTGERSIRITTLRNHETVSEAVMTVSANGKTLTYGRSGGPYPATGVVVYQKQD